MIASIEKKHVDMACVGGGGKERVGRTERVALKHIHYHR